MADTTRTIAGFGDFHYDAVVYDELMKLSKAELVERELDGTIFVRTAVRGLRKADLAVLVAHRETARREWDAATIVGIEPVTEETYDVANPPAAIAERRNAAHANLKARGQVLAARQDQSVNEAVDGGQVATRWLALDPSLQTETPEQMATRLAAVPSPQRDYQSSQEALDVLEVHLAEVEGGDHRDGCECAACDEFHASDPMADATAEQWDDYLASVEASNNADADAELLSFMRTVVEAPRLELPMTETDVKSAEVYVVVQLRGALYDGKLIAVVNRRTHFVNPICATVEVGGHRFLVNADDLLAA